jgi:hypothetical protein
MNKEELHIILYKENRFAIVDINGNIIDDSQGVGFKNMHSANTALDKKFSKIEDKNPLEWKFNNFNYNFIKKKFDEMSKAKKKMKPEDIWNNVEDMYNIVIPNYIKNI